MGRKIYEYVEEQLTLVDIEYQEPSELDLFNDELNEKIINSSMTGDEIIEKVYSQPDLKPYD